MVWKGKNANTICIAKVTYSNFPILEHRDRLDILIAVACCHCMYPCKKLGIRKLVLCRPWSSWRSEGHGKGTWLTNHLCETLWIRARLQRSCCTKILSLWVLCFLHNNLGKEKHILHIPTGRTTSLLIITIYMASYSISFSYI